MWHGVDLSTVEYFQYRIGGQDLYLPATPILGQVGRLWLDMQVFGTNGPRE